MSDINIAELRRLANNATPGPWISNRAGLMGDPVVTTGERVDEILFEGFTGTQVDAEFIASWNPTTAKAVLDHLEAAEAAIGRVRDVCDQLGQVDGDVSQPAPSYYVSVGRNVVAGEVLAALAPVTEGGNDE